MAFRVPLCAPTSGRRRNRRPAMSSIDYTFGWAIAAYLLGYVIHGGHAEPLAERILRAVLMGVVAFLVVACVHMMMI